MKKAIKWILIIFIALMVIGLIFGGDDQSDNDMPDTAYNSEEIQSSQPGAQGSIAVEVLAEDLYKAYENNEVAADKAYKGKILAVSGTVAGIESGLTDAAIVQLKTSNEFMPISAQGKDEFTNKAATLSKGDEIKITCKGAGEVAGFVQLEDCVIK